jgi:hypothetical protein
MDTQTDLKGFRDFVTELLSSGGDDLSPEQCLDMWRISHPSDDLAAEDVAAVYASIEDFKRGERGRPAGQTTQELRKELGIQSNE